MGDEEVARRLANLSAFQQELDAAGVGRPRSHRKPEPEPGLPRQLDVSQREAAYRAVGEAIGKLGQLSTALAGGGPVITDAAFAAAVAEAVVPLEHAAREACRHD
jgi:hypothetical protein